MSSGVTVVAFRFQDAFIIPPRGGPHGGNETRLHFASVISSKAVDTRTTQILASITVFLESPPQRSCRVGFTVIELRGETARCGIPGIPFFAIKVLARQRVFCRSVF